MRFFRPLAPAVVIFAFLMTVLGETAKDKGYAESYGFTLSLEDGLSSRELIALALHRNPGLRAMRMARESALAGIAKAKELPDPELRMGWSELNDGAVLFGNSRFDMTARWSPPRIGEKKWQSRWAKGNVTEIEGELGAIEQRLVADLLFLHTKISFLDRQVTLAEDSIKVYEEMANLIREQLRAEVKGLPDLDKVELDLAEAKMQPGTYRMERTLCLRRLAKELNLIPSANLKIQTDGDPLAYRPRTIDSDSLIRKAQSQRPELVSSSGQIAQADALLGLEKIKRYPWLSFVQGGKQFADSSSSGTWGFRFGIDLPIFKQRKSSLQPLSAEVERRKLEQEDWKQKIGIEIEELALQLQAQYQKAEHFIKEVDPALQKELDHTQQAAAVGDTDPVPFLAARIRRLEKQQDYLANLLECRRLEIELDWASGTITDPQQAT